MEFSNESIFKKIKSNSYIMLLLISPKKVVITHLQRIKLNKLFKYLLKVKKKYLPTTPLLKLSDHSQSIRSVSFDPWGRYLSIGSNENVAIIYCIDTYDPTLFGKPVARIMGKRSNSITLKDFLVTGSINAVCFSNKGMFFSVGSYDSTSIIYDATKLIEGKTEEILHLKGHTKPVRSICFSPCDKYFASGGLDKKIIIYGCDKTNPNQFGKILNNICDHTKSVRSVKFAPLGNLIASGSSDKLAMIFKFYMTEDNVFTIQNKFVICKHDRTINSVCFSPSGDYIATCSNDKTALIYGVNSLVERTYAKEIFKIKVSKTISTACFSSCENYIFLNY